MSQTPADAVLYAERATRPWMWRTCWVLLVLVSVLPVALDPSATVGRAVLDLVVYALVWGLVVWIALLTLWSVERYGRITLTGRELRVGRHRLAVADLDGDDVRAQLTARRTPIGPGRPTGGAYGRTLGRGGVVLRTRAGEEQLVETRDADALLAALASVCR